jgi:hypothetical protein
MAIELHHVFNYLLVSRRSWWYVDEVEDETQKRDNKRHLCTIDIWNYQYTIEISLYLAMWTLLHSKRRFFENMLSRIAKSGSIPLYTISGSIVFSEVCLSQNLYQNLSQNSLSTVVFSKALLDDLYSSWASVWATSLEGGLKWRSGSEKIAKSREWRPWGAPTTDSTWTSHSIPTVI